MDITLDARLMPDWMQGHCRGHITHLVLQYYLLVLESAIWPDEIIAKKVIHEED
jgi:hypothetical protein